MSDPWRRTAGELAAAVRGGELSAAELWDSVRVRLEQVEPRIRAFLRIFEASREQAEAIDRRRRAGEVLGPLAGVPVAVKDNLSLRGDRLTCGSRILDGYRATYDATAVARLRSAGAVVIGKTNLDEFAMGSSCESSSFHPTHNPWDPERVPGGSSGGSAAAVAAAVPLAFGSDTGGSIRQPAAFCGVVGLKPTYGRVSRRGLVAFTSSTDQVGPLARSVRDSALAYRALAGHDPLDATSSRRRVDDPLSGIEAGIRGLRIGIPEQIAGSGLSDDVAASWQRTLELLEQLGAELREVSVPSLDAAIACYYVLSGSEASSNLSRFDGVRYGLRASADSLDELYVQSRSQGFGEEVKRRILVGTFALSSGYYEAYYARAQRVRRTLALELGRALEGHHVLISPTAPSGAFRIEIDR